MTPPEHWHVTVTLAGVAQAESEVCDALHRLLDERPLLQSCRYGPDAVELRYWDQADDVADVAAMALRLWCEHRRIADLPDWHVVGLEVVDRDTYHRRRNDGPLPSAVSALADVRPF